ncbi:MAG: peptide chain release factor N(5)-glutamine methyltransferase [Solirubrobacterales bacterium]
MSNDWTVQDLLDWTREHFHTRSISEPRLEAEVLLAFALNTTRVGLYVQYDRPVNAEERSWFKELVKRRQAGEPVAYITGSREFMSMPFKVDRRVLIPRPDTETLVEAAIKHLKGLKRPCKAVDVGTGSGAIAVSLARYVPDAEIIAVDIDPSALELAGENASVNGLADRVVFLTGSLLSPVEADELDLVAANLPYIPTAEMTKLAKEIREFEPVLALDGGPDGLDYYRGLLPQAYARLRPGGLLLMEISDQAQAEALIADCGPGWQAQCILCDLGGRARVVGMNRGEQ